MHFFQKTKESILCNSCFDEFEAAWGSFRRGQKLVQLLWARRVAWPADLLSWQLYFLRPQIHFPQITSSWPNVNFYLLSLTLTCCYCYDLKGLKYPGLPFSDVPGKIFALDLQDPRIKPVELRMPRNFDLESFNPHGISVYVNQTGEWAKLTLWLTCTRGSTKNLPDIHHAFLFWLSASSLCCGFTSAGFSSEEINWTLQKKKQQNKKHGLLGL